MKEAELLSLIESALRTPELFTERRSINENAMAWQTRAVATALKQKGII